MFKAVDLQCKGAGTVCWLLWTERWRAWGYDASSSASPAAAPAAFWRVLTGRPSDHEKGAQK
jgi:hypothetical protein